MRLAPAPFFSFLALCPPFPVFAQKTAATAVSVPFIGCVSYGQTQLLEAPKGTSKSARIDPNDARRMVVASDQGTVVTVDGGRTWSSWYNQPTAQMYHVATDDRFPYWIYGAQQDSGAAATPSRTDYRSIGRRDIFASMSCSFIWPRPSRTICSVSAGPDSR